MRPTPGAIWRFIVANVILYTFHTEFDAETPYELNKIRSTNQNLNYPSTLKRENTEDVIEELEEADEDEVEKVLDESKPERVAEEIEPEEGQVDIQECVGFAEAVESKLTCITSIEPEDYGSDITTSISNSDVLHVWLTDGTYHYDAEVPLGVKDPEKLPVFQRN